MILTLDEIANGIEKAHRFNSDDDTPEGTSYIQMSDTLAKRIVGSLHRHRAIFERHADLIDTLDAMEVLAVCCSRLEDPTTVEELRDVLVLPRAMGKLFQHAQNLVKEFELQVRGEVAR